MLLPIAALLLIALGVGGWVMMRKPASGAPAQPAVQPVAQASTVSVPTPQATVPTQQGRLGINAFPWANVTSIRNLDSGQNVDDRTEPRHAGAVDLAPGRYEVTLSNPQFRQPITRTVCHRRR